MSFIIRSVTHEDLTQLVDLAKQFNLLNLPGDKSHQRKIERSEQGFCRKTFQEPGGVSFCRGGHRGKMWWEVLLLLPNTAAK